MDKRLEQIESFSKKICENRHTLCGVVINKSYAYDVVSDLDELCEALSQYGNEIKYPLFIDGDQRILVIRAFEGDSYARYRLEEKKRLKNKFGEELNIYSSLDPDFTYDMANEIMDKIKENKEAGKYYSTDLPLPTSDRTWTYLIENWEKIYNDLLDKILEQLENELSHQEDQIERCKKYIT